MKKQKLAKYLQFLDEQELRAIRYMTQLRCDRYRSLDGSIRQNRVLKQKSRWAQIPFPIRFALLHFMITMLTLSQYPPAPELPFVLLPLTWAASFAVTLTLFGVVFPRPVRNNV